VDAQWPSPGDEREDRATRVGETIGAVYEQVEMVIIAAVASLARKVATGALNPAAAVRHLCATVNTALGQAAPQARRALEEAIAGAADQLRATLPLPVRTPTLPVPAGQWMQPLAGILDQATGTAAETAQNELIAITVALGRIFDEPAAETAAGEGRRAIAARLPPPGPPDGPYGAALGEAFGRFAQFPGQSLSYRRVQAAQVMLDELAGRGITGYTDRIGRNWDLATYCEMATRTATANAWDDMQAGLAAGAGLDLVETSTHSTEGSCPLCVPWLGKVLSLTGATPGHPTIAGAKAAGWRHPNCRCFWLVIGAGYTVDVTNPVPTGEAARVYELSQHQRLLERRVRTEGRAAQAAVTPQAKTRARHRLAAARAASAAHREQHKLSIMAVTSKRREALHGPR